MMHIVDMCWASDDDIIANLQGLQRANERGEANEDDCEVTAPWLNILPEETSFDREEPSPIKMKVPEQYRIIDEAIQTALIFGWSDVL